VLHGYLKTPLFAAFLCAALSACLATDKERVAGPAQCPEQTVAVAGIQGDGRESALQGQQVTVQGTVTLIQNGRGLYIEEAASDTNRQTSNAIFIESANLPSEAGPGSLVSVTGKVAELGADRDPLTAITEISKLVICSPGHALPLSEVSLPLDGPARESLEGMRIRVSDSLVVTDVYQFDQGKFTLSGNGFQFVPTEVMAPGSAAAQLHTSNRAFTLPVLRPEGLDHPGLVVGGMRVDQVTGVLAHDERGKRLTLQSFSGQPGEITTALPNADADALRVVGMNLHNYFNGDGNGQGFPTPRGAETPDEFQRQRERTGAAISVLNPHLLAVMELENDGFGPHSAAQDLIQLANDTTRSHWSVTRPINDDTGTDKITVGMFYRTDRLKAIGPAHTLTGPEFKRSRQPQAQLFEQLPGGETLLVVINHLKSKGSCPDAGLDMDQKDGQGCWNDTRRLSAEKMSAWANALAASSGTDRILILGDMNAYRNEDPIGAIRQAGFTELMERDRLPTYSFVFAGQRGTLDYAFVSDALLEQARADIWHVNAAFPDRVELPQPWLGFSDHDPVVVELSSRHSSTSD
jgi:predicted extracellular nuclease